MKTPATAPTVWTERYEALRQHVLGNRQHLGADPLGLVLLMRQGLAAWMRSWRELGPTPAPQPVAGPPQAVVPPTPVWQRQLTELLAQMTSAHLFTSSAL